MRRELMAKVRTDPPNHRSRALCDNPYRERANTKMVVKIGRAIVQVSWFDIR